MAVNLKGRNFLTLMDFTPEEIRYMPVCSSRCAVFLSRKIKKKDQNQEMVTEHETES